MKYKKRLVILICGMIGIVIVLILADHLGAPENILIVLVVSSVILCFAGLVTGFQLWNFKRIAGEAVDWQKKFKKYFGLEIDWEWFSKDTIYKSWRDKNSKEQVIIQNRIDKILPLLAEKFLKVCEEEKRLMEPYYSSSSILRTNGKGVSKVKNEKKDLNRLKKIRMEISITEDKFQNAKKAAQEGGFQVEASAREYIKKETKQVVKKEKES